MTTFRSVLHWFHRYTGLFMAVFLILTSVTGMALTFHSSLDDWLNQDYVVLDTIPQQSTLPITRLYHSVQAHYPNASFSTLPLTPFTKDRSVSFRVDRNRGKSPQQHKVDFQIVYVNPYTAEIIATRDKDEWAWRNAMYKVFWFHRTLLLGDFGKLLLGIVALLWTINCFVGVYLTLPRSTKRKKGKKRKRASVLKRWLPAWTIRRTTNIFKLSFDAHHALSLWLWAMMFVLAWSSVGFNLHSVYRPVMTLIFAPTKTQPTPPQSDNRTKGDKDNTPSVKASTPSIITVTTTQIDNAKATVQQLAHERQVTVTEFTSFSTNTQSAEQTIRFKTNLDTVGRGSSVTFATQAVDTNTRDSHPFKVNWGFERSNKDTVSMWLVYLHRGFVWGTPYKVFLMFVGLATAIVSGTGIYLWWRGRQSRLSKKARSKKRRLDVV